MSGPKKCCSAKGPIIHFRGDWVAAAVSGQMSFYGRGLGTF